jgi:hypothetical protein
MSRKFNGFWIPYEIIEQYGVRKAFITQAYKYNAPNLTKKQIREARKILGVIKLKPNEIKKYILTKRGSHICKWCKQRTFVLCSHHYPTSKRDGGVKTVKICARCHLDYHYVEQAGIINRE